VRSRALTLRALVLLAAASAAVHELRYLIGYGGRASHALAAHPHGYLSVAMPGVITATLITLAAVLLRVAGARASAIARGGNRRSLAFTWFACTVALAVIYGTQETLEGAGAFAGSGWLGFALAVPAGLLVAVTIRGADAAELLRAPGAALHAHSIVAAATAMRPPASHSLVVRRRIRARAPPLAFVV
jgi:hypothetical protein